MNRREFLESGIAAAAAVSMTRIPALQIALEKGNSERFILQAKGLAIFENGRPVRLRGVNLGGWMLIEDYMIGLPWTDWKIREQFRRVLGEAAYSAYFDAWDASYIADADCAFLAQQGFTFVRLPFNYRLLESDLDPGNWLEKGFRLLDHAVELCRKHGLWVLLDLHAAPGAQARDQNAGSAFGEAYFWNYRHFIYRMAALWKEIARRYRGDTTIAGYNLLCEPVTNDVNLLNRVCASAIRAIREVDSDHLIVQPLGEGHKQSPQQLIRRRTGDSRAPSLLSG
jgi:aryl-phospho-beta-D-glucosidase BglC (GH1 family)